MITTRFLFILLTLLFAVGPIEASEQIEKEIETELVHQSSESKYTNQQRHFKPGKKGTYAFPADDSTPRISISNLLIIDNRHILHCCLLI